MAIIAAVNAIFFRRSAIRNAFTKVPSTGLRLAVEDVADAAGRFDLLASGLGVGVCVDGELLLQLALAEDLDRDALALGEARIDERLRADLGAVVEACLEVGEVHRLGVRPEVLERH